MAELANRPKLESDLARRLARLSSRHRRELDSLLGWPPDPTRVPGEFWARVERDEQSLLAIWLLLIADESVALHGATPGSVDAEIQAFANQRATTTARGYAAHSRDRLQQSWRKWDALMRAGKVLRRRDVTEDLVSIFGPGRDAQIAETETGVAQVDGGEIAINRRGIVVARYWAHSRHRPRGHSHASDSPCPICTPLEGKPEDQWGGRRPGHAHPLCDCYVEYIDPDTGKTIGFGSDGGPRRPARRDALGRLMRE